MGTCQVFLSADWQTLLKGGSIKVTILQGGVSDDDEYILEVFKRLVEAKIAGEGVIPAGALSRHRLSSSYPAPRRRTFYENY